MATTSIATASPLILWNSRLSLSAANPSEKLPKSLLFVYHRSSENCLSLRPLCTADPLEKFPQSSLFVHRRSSEEIASILALYGNRYTADPLEKSRSAVQFALYQLLIFPGAH